jgi:AraC family transcriptional regulator
MSAAGGAERMTAHRQEPQPKSNRAVYDACMNEPTARSDYAIRLERVFTWLVDHLDETLDLVRLADVACMSPYHFHRIYHFMQGETAAETVRRLRLHRAAVELITGQLPVSRIARRAGYGSQEAFTRAFKTAYGVPPARYRAAFVPMPARKRTEHAMETMETGIRYQATTRVLPTITVAALAHRGDYQEIAGTFVRLASMAGALGVFGPGTRSFGIYYDDPSATPVEALRSEACVTVPDDWAPGGDLERREIRGGRYAVALHVGPYAELGRAYEWLYGTWLAQSGEEAADAPCVEEYLNDARTVPPAELRTEIWLPLR